MKKLPILWLIAALLIGCKPSIDAQLDKLEKQYASGDEEASAATWSKLWERQNEMSMVQVARFVKLTEANDPEWHYDEVDDDSGVTAVGVYMESRAEAAPAVAPQSASAGYSGAPQLSYYECASCGLIVKSADYPARANGICYHRDGRTSHHMFIAGGDACAPGQRLRTRTIGHSSRKWVQSISFHAENAGFNSRRINAPV